MASRKATCTSATVDMVIDCTAPSLEVNLAETNWVGEGFTYSFILKRITQRFKTDNTHLPDMRGHGQDLRAIEKLGLERSLVDRCQVLTALTCGKRIYTAKDGQRYQDWDMDHDLMARHQVQVAEFVFLAEAMVGEGHDTQKSIELLQSVENHIRTLRSGPNLSKVEATAENLITAIHDRLHGINSQEHSNVDRARHEKDQENDKTFRKRTAVQPMTDKDPEMEIDNDLCCVTEEGHSAKASPTLFPDRDEEDLPYEIADPSISPSVHKKWPEKAAKTTWYSDIL